MRRLAATAALLLAAGCASTTVPMEEPRRLLGTENGVRVDAYIRSDILTTNNALPLLYDITNERSEPIAFADLVPNATYDEETQTVTVSLGSEVPGQNMVPRLVTIAPGEKKSFQTVARVRLMIPLAADTAPLVPLPKALQVKVNFLGGDLRPFDALMDISQRAVQDPKLADALFPLWVERNEVVFTNAVPMKWRRMMEPAGGASRRR